MVPSDSELDPSGSESDGDAFAGDTVRDDGMSQRDAGRSSHAAMKSLEGCNGQQTLAQELWSQLQASLGSGELSHHLQPKQRLLAESVHLRFNTNKSRLGLTRYARDGGPPVIELSLAFLQHATRECIYATLLHEATHALVGHGYGHGPTWQALNRQLGGDGQRCAQQTEATQAVRTRQQTAYPFELRCTGNEDHKRYPRTRTSNRRFLCGECGETLAFWHKNTAERVPVDELLHGTKRCRERKYVFFCPAGCPTTYSKCRLTPGQQYFCRTCKTALFCNQQEMYEKSKQDCYELRCPKDPNHQRYRKARVTATEYRCRACKKENVTSLLEYWTLNPERKLVLEEKGANLKRRQETDDSRGASAEIRQRKTGDANSSTEAGTASHLEDRSAAGFAEAVAKWNSNRRRPPVETSWFGCEVSFYQQTYIVDGLAPKATKNCMLLREKASGKMRVASPEQVRDAIKSVTD